MIDFLVDRFDVNPDFVRAAFWGALGGVIGGAIGILCLVALLIGFAVMGGWLIDLVR